MCDDDKHDYVVAGFSERELVLVCRKCGDKRTHEVGENFKISDLHYTIEEKL